MTGWRVFVVVALSGVLALCGWKWWERGLGYGDYGYAGMMVATVWWSAYLAGRVSGIFDPKFRRLLIAYATAVAIPPLCYHVYDGRNWHKTGATLVLLFGITVYAYSQLVMRPREERSRPPAA